MVSVTADGRGRVKKITIDPAVVDADGDASVLRQPALRDIQAREDLETRCQGQLDLFGQNALDPQNAVHQENDGRERVLDADLRAGVARSHVFGIW